MPARIRKTGSLELNRLLTPIYLLCLLYLVGTIGYYLIGLYAAQTGRIAAAWSITDCGFMTAITLTTVGYADVLGVQHYAPAALYTIVLLFVGMGIVAYGVSEFTSLLVEGHLGHVLERRRLMKKVDQLKDHIVIAGMGEMGDGAAQELAEADVAFVAVEQDQSRCERIRVHHPDRLLIEGDANDEEVLSSAGIDRAHGLICCLPSDKDNVFLTITARSLNPKLRIVARADALHVETKLKAAGADRVILPAVTGGLRLASEMIRPQVVSFLDRMIRESAQYRFGEAEIGKGSKLDGRTLRDADVRAKTSMNIIAVRTAAGEYHYNVDIERPLGAGDILFAIGTPKMFEALKDLCR